MDGKIDRLKVALDTLNAAIALNEKIDSPPRESHFKGKGHDDHVPYSSDYLNTADHEYIAARHSLFLAWEMFRDVVDSIRLEDGDT